MMNGTTAVLLLSGLPVAVYASSWIAAAARNRPRHTLSAWGLLGPAGWVVAALLGIHDRLDELVRVRASAPGSPGPAGPSAAPAATTALAGDSMAARASLAAAAEATIWTKCPKCQAEFVASRMDGRPTICKACNARFVVHVDSGARPQAPRRDAADDPTQWAPASRTGAGGHGRSGASARYSSSATRSAIHRTTSSLRDTREAAMSVM